MPSKATGTAKKSKTAQEAFNQLETKKQDQAVKASVPFNFQNYQVSPEPETKTVAIEGTEDEFEVTVKNLSWSRRNQILAKSLKWTSDGQTNFDGDLYTRNCLKEILVNAPWGRTTEAFLLSIDDRLGNALEVLVPRAFGDGGEEVALKDTDDIKKES